MAKKVKEVSVEGGVESANEAPAKVAAPKVDIIRGRMPLAIVCLIKTNEPKTATVAELAAKYRTTVGKINDVLKASNFQYITENFKPTADMVAAAKAYAAQLEGHAESVTDAIDSLGVATAEDAAAFEAEKAKYRKPREKKTAPAGAPAATDAGENEEDLEEVLED